MLSTTILHTAIVPLVISLRLEYNIYYSIFYLFYHSFSINNVSAALTHQFHILALLFTTILHTAIVPLIIFLRLDNNTHSPIVWFFYHSFSIHNVDAAMTHWFHMLAMQFITILHTAIMPLVIFLRLEYNIYYPIFYFFYHSFSIHNVSAALTHQFHILALLFTTILHTAIVFLVISLTLEYNILLSIFCFFYHSHYLFSSLCP